jgi:TatD DNase family protein
VITRALKAGLERILIPGIDLASSQSAIQLAGEHEKIFTAVGVHPNSSLTWDRRTIETIMRLASHTKVVAIGEIGLDYYRKRAPQEHQQHVFKSQLDLAKASNLPVIIHTRNVSPDDRRCISDLLEILSIWKPKIRYPGVVHSYSGNETEVERLMDLGYFIGITGPITYKKATSLRKVVESIPLNKLLIETDGPFLTPHPYRGKRNEPAYVKFIAEQISQVHQCPVEKVIQQTYENALKLFRWGEA